MSATGAIRALREVVWMTVLLANMRPASAQTTGTQFWSDLTVGRNFASRYMAELEVGYQTLVEGSPQWSAISLTPTLEASVSPHLDVISGFPWSDTRQDDETRTREFRVQLGARYHVLPFKRVQPRLTWRYEYRSFNTLEPEAFTSQSDRTRINAAVWVPLNKPLMSFDTLWAVFVDYELFVVFDEQLQERYANRSTARIGLVRKFSYNWRAEVIYSLLHYRDELEQLRADQDIDHIFRVSLKYYFTPPERRMPSATRIGT
jgi:hypothetical protein